MNNYILDISKFIPKNKSCSLLLGKNIKAPLNPLKVDISRDYNNRFSLYFNRPHNVNIAGQKFKNVREYNYVHYKDGVTDNGILYNFYDSQKDTSLYLIDGKFYSKIESYKYPQQVNIGDYSLKGYLTKTLNSDGVQKYDVVTPSYSKKSIIITPSGDIIGPKKGFLEK